MSTCALSGGMKEEGKPTGLLNCLRAYIFATNVCSKGLEEQGGAVRPSP